MCYKHASEVKNLNETVDIFADNLRCIQWRNQKPHSPSNQHALVFGMIF